MIEYKSQFNPSESAEHVLRSGKIIGPDESAADMVSRVVTTLATQEEVFSNDSEAKIFANELGTALDAKEVIMSTPIMTNAGRHYTKPLAACTVPTAELGSATYAQLRDEMISLHEQGMGTGFNLDETTDPVKMLRFLNKVAVESAESGREERPVGNMAVLSVRHPKIMEFINSKVDAPRTGEEWKFNISINLDDPFMEAVDNGEIVTLTNGKRIPAQVIFQEICAAAAICADPGVVFLDRMNFRNPVPGMGEYKTTAPCAEVGLIEGETCQFGYINLGKFIRLDGKSTPYIDFKRLEEITLLMTRALDNGLQISHDNFANATTKHVSNQKRKVGIGLCGVADALTIAGLPYDSEVARVLMQDVLSFINFASKEASIRLGEARGSFGAMHTSIGNRYLETPGYLDSLYGDKDTNSVEADEWANLSNHIRNTRTLRNVSTIALPPTGRSALIIDASTGIEPHFDAQAAEPGVLKALEERVNTTYGRKIDLRRPETHPPEVKEILANATSIRPLGHIGMVAALQQFTDEAVAKTINLPKGSSSEAVRDAYTSGYRAGMSGVTVYVDGTHKIQPKKIK